MAECTFYAYDSSHVGHTHQRCKRCGREIIHDPAKGRYRVPCPGAWAPGEPKIASTRKPCLPCEAERKRRKEAADAAAKATDKQSTKVASENEVK